MPGSLPAHRLLIGPRDVGAPRRVLADGGRVDVAAAYGRGRGGPGARAGTVEAGYHFAPQESAASTARPRRAVRAAERRDWFG